MLEEKLQQARLQSAKRMRHLIVALSIAAGLCVAIIIGISSLDVPLTTDTEALVPEKEGQLAVNPEQAREQFKERLKNYERQWEPLVQEANLALWNQRALSELEQRKQQAVTDFSVGEYRQALRGMETLEERAKEILAEKERIFTEELDKARSFLERDLYHEAKLHVEKALAVDPSSPQAQEVQHRIKSLPKILPLLDEAKVARVENNPEKELDRLRRVLDIDPDRSEVAARVEELTERLNDRAFKHHISAGLESLEQQRTQEARRHYLAAKTIYPTRQEVATLSSRLLAQERTIRVEAALNKANKAIRRDHWQTAQTHFAKAAKDAPTDPRVVEGLKRAKRILALQATLHGYSSHPYRLTDDHIRTSAETTLSQAETAAKFSFSLKKQLEGVTDLIARVNTKIPIKVISDNNTYVQVRGVGKVGTVLEKTIHLKPGRYTFEGQRNGFVSKLITVLIPYDRNRFTVEVICDQPI